MEKNETTTHEDVVVSEITNPEMAYRALHETKEPDAKWVVGLAPDPPAKAAATSPNTRQQQRDKKGDAPKDSCCCIS